MKIKLKKKKKKPLLITFSGDRGDEVNLIILFPLQIK